MFFLEIKKRKVVVGVGRFIIEAPLRRKERKRERERESGDRELCGHGVCGVLTTLPSFSVNCFTLCSPVQCCKSVFKKKYI